MGKLGVYGGSFNPPHIGHVLAAQEAAAALSLDRVIFLPAAQPPHKQLPDGTPDAQTRLALTRAAVSGLPFAEVSDLEFCRPGASYTADSLALLQAENPGDTLYLMMGTDMFLSLHTWSRPEQICRIADIVLASREEADDIVLLAQKTRLEEEFGARVHLLNNRFIELSSTIVRRMAAFRCIDELVPAPVAEMIAQNGLYNFGANWKGLPFEELERISLSLHKDKRIAHVKGCCRTAVELAQRWGADPTDAARAGILHDVTKALDGRNQLRLCEKYDIIIDTFEREHTKLLHSKTGSAVAQNIFGENDAVVDAIYWHTTGKGDMTLLEKIIYLADYIEPCRSFDGVQQIRDMAMKDLDRALLMGFELSIEELLREKKPLGQYSVQARDFLRKELNA